MTTQRTLHQPPVGVLAANCNIAESLIRELGLRNAVAINPSGRQCRGMGLRALLVDESAWPLSSPAKAAVLPALEKEHGYVMAVHRYDPLRKEEPEEQAS